MSKHPAPPPRVVGPYLQPLLEACSACGIDRMALGAAACLPPGLLSRPVDELGVEAYVGLLEAASRLSGDPGFGLKVGQFVRPGAYGVLGITLLSCETLGVALTQVLRFEALVHDLGTSELQRLPDGSCRFLWRNRVESGVLVDAVFAGMLGFAGWLTGRELPLLAMELASPVLPLADYERFYRAPVGRGADNAFRFDAGLLDWRLPLADARLLPVLASWAERLLAERNARQAWLPRLRQVLREALPAVPAVGEVAARLHLSPRTLQRRLQDAGTTFLKESEAVRRAMAEDYLRHSGLVVTEIAYLLGYREPSSFSHAFRSWHGVSPQQFRRQGRGGGGPGGG